MARAALPTDGRPRSPARRRSGRGAQSNASGRFEREKREGFDDGWETVEETSLERPPTEVTTETPRRVITRNSSPDVPFDRSINPYRGCEHGCPYCFARPTHAFMGLSPGLDFERRLFAKPDAGKTLARELSAKSYRCRPIAIGTNTDPYQPIERTWRIMRGVLETLSRFNHPVTILTKNAGVVRDLDLLAPMAERGLVKVGLSITTEDRALARAMEPRASTPDKRFEAVRALSDAGVPTAVMTAPIILGLNDHEIESLLERAAGSGAREAGFTLLRLPLEVSQIFREWVEATFPDRAAKIIRLLQESHGGLDHDPRFGKRMSGEGPHAEMAATRFRTAAARLGLGKRTFVLRTDLFAPPKPETPQLSLFCESEA
ncbi:MAG: PA0069 family radical SAM protein [Pseudomonadota bacterium]